MKTFKRQAGLTAISMAVLLVIGAFFVLLALRLVPIYLENFKVRSHLQTLAKDPEIRSMSDEEILDKLFRRFDIDDVDNVKRDDVVIEELEDKKRRITITYEVRTSALANVDMIASFVEQADADN